MSPDLNKALVRDFPNLYADHKWFECDDGWEPLIRELSAKLEKMILAQPEETRGDFKAAQVKEKFGSLRFYVSQGTDEMYAAIDEAEALSSKTCELCGRPGKARAGGWIKTLCDACNLLR